MRTTEPITRRTQLLLDDRADAELTVLMQVHGVGLSQLVRSLLHRAYLGDVLERMREFEQAEPEQSAEVEQVEQVEQVETVPA